jgi:hypothetical protein
MLTRHARLNIVVALVVPGIVLLDAGVLFLIWYTQPWLPYVAAIVVGIALIASGIAMAPPDPRRPRGGPMIDPERTIVVPGSRSDADP